MTLFPVMVPSSNYFNSFTIAAIALSPNIFKPLDACICVNITVTEAFMYLWVSFSPSCLLLSMRDRNWLFLTSYFSCQNWAILILLLCLYFLVQSYLIAPPILMMICCCMYHLPLCRLFVLLLIMCFIYIIEYVVNFFTDVFWFIYDLVNNVIVCVRRILSWFLPIVILYVFCICDVDSIFCIIYFNVFTLNFSFFLFSISSSSFSTRILSLSGMIISLSVISCPGDH